MIMSNVSFGSMFNPEKVSRRHVEGKLINPEDNLERLNAHQAGRAMSDSEFSASENFLKYGRAEKDIEEHICVGCLNNPEYNLENLKAGREISRALPLYPTETLGRSQIREVGNLEPIKMSDEDLSLLRSLSSDKYGFSPNGREFWVHSKNKKEDGTYTFTMADGKLKEGTNKKEFIKGLIGDDVQGLNVAGKTLDGEPVSIAFVYDKENEGTTIYSSKYPDGEACLEYLGKDGFREAILDNLKELKTIYGATVWK